MFRSPVVTAIMSTWVNQGEPFAWQSTDRPYRRVQPTTALQSTQQRAVIVINWAKVRSMHGYWDKEQWKPSRKEKFHVPRYGLTSPLPLCIHSNITATYSHLLLHSSSYKQLKKIFGWKHPTVELKISTVVFCLLKNLPQSSPNVM